jgi:hypothetical protein
VGLHHLAAQKKANVSVCQYYFQIDESGFVRQGQSAMTKRERKALAQALGRLAAGKAKTMTDAARAQRKAAALASAQSRRKPDFVGLETLSPS